MTKAAHCVKFELSLHQMGYWRKGLQHHDGSLPQPTQSLFEPVVKDAVGTPGVEMSLGVQIVFPSGIMIECTPTTDIHVHESMLA